MFILILFVNLGSSAVQPSNQLNECHDMHGQTIEQGRHYVPGPDICKYVLFLDFSHTTADPTNLFVINSVFPHFGDFFIIDFFLQIMRVRQWPCERV